MLLLWLALAALVPGDEDPQRDVANTAELRHQVSFKLIAPDVAALTVTREFGARSPANAVRFDRQLRLPDQSVVTSFAIRSDGAWREGRLGPKVVADKKANKTGGVPTAARPRPWASLEGQTFRAVRMATPSFRATEPVQVRYTLWAQAIATDGGRRWVYCGRDPNAGDKDEKIVPEITLPPGHPELRVLPDPASETCLIIEKTEPAGTVPSARFGAYQLGPHAWWWRLELVVPEKTAVLPTPPESAPVVFVLDGSRSQTQNGGLAHQLAIIESYLANTPGADVELVLANRTAQRVFDRFVPAGGFKQALPVGLAKRSLGNGSFLDRGAELAVDALASTGKPGRIILMTDGVVRSRFQTSAVVATLRRAPAGSIVHVVYPSAGTANETISHNVPDGLDELAATFGGGSYSISVNRNRKDGSFHAPAPDLLHALVKPEGLESLRLYDASVPTSKKEDAGITLDKSADGDGGGFDWSEALNTDQALAGEGRVWSGVSETPPPKRLAVAGWVWTKKVELAVRADASFDQRLARLVTAEGEVMECEETGRHRKDALTQHFLAPALVFRVAGDGPPEDVEPGGAQRACPGDLESDGTNEPPSKAQDLVPQLGNVLRRCAMVPDPTGTIQVKVETHLVEILDVAVKGGEDWERQCLEDGIWAVNLPTTFNEGHTPRVEYALTLASKKAAPH